MTCCGSKHTFPNPPDPIVLASEKLLVSFLTSSSEKSLDPGSCKALELLPGNVQGEPDPRPTIYR